MATRAQVVEALRLAVARRCYAIQANAHAELTAATPVDTGFARANWQTTLDEPARGTVELGTVADPLPEAVAADAERLRFVTNNASYIRRLDAGHSQQAPAGFVREALARAVRS